MPKERSALQVGADNEIQVACLLKTAGWRPWRVPHAKFAREDRFESQDVWEAFDIMAIRPFSRVLGIQVGTRGSQKRKQVDLARLPVYFGPTGLATHLAPQVWAYEVEDGRIIVDELQMTGWERIGYCTLDGDKLQGKEAYPWPLRRL